MTENPVTLSNGIKVDIDEFSQDKFTFLALRLDEYLGGGLPSGSLRMRAIEQPQSDEKVSKTNFFKILIEQEDPVVKYDVGCFITSRNFTPGMGVYDIGFVCVPDTKDGKNGKFFSKTKRKKYKGKTAKDVIKETWGSDPIWKTDANPPGKDWFQDREFDAAFLERICMSIKKKTLFAYDFDGLIVKDIFYKDRVYEDKQEPHRLISGYEDMQPTQDSIDSRYNFKMYRPIEKACTDGEYAYGKEISKHFDIQIHEDTYMIVHTDLQEQNTIYNYNRRFVTGGMFGVSVIRYTDNLPPQLRLLDAVLYAKVQEEEVPPVDTYIIGGVHIFLSGVDTEVDRLGARYSTEFDILACQDLLGTKLPDSEADDPGQK